MNTPVADFVRAYAASGTARLHMPGHKGRPRLGCEPFDLTEIAGADSLYEASGILAESEQNAARLFGTARTLYSTEGASQCVRAMLYLALAARRNDMLPVIVAARNVHKSFVYAAALLDFQPVWLWPEENAGLCACPVSPGALDAALARLPAPPAAVYLTSPDYLGGQQDIAALAEVCHRRGTLLLVDNAHGAYLHFLPRPEHPIDLGADLCCDSAHKTLPVLTGGAYLHIAPAAPAACAAQAKAALALFGSTSPSYLTLASLDLCNALLAGDYPARLAATAQHLAEGKRLLAARGWQVAQSDPLRVTVLTSASGLAGTAAAERLRQGGAECEFADRDALVLMLTPENAPDDLTQALDALDLPPKMPPSPVSRPPAIPLEACCSPRAAIFAPQETVPLGKAAGRICGTPAVSCPPAVPIAVSGERLTSAVLERFAYYGQTSVDVVAEAALADLQCSWGEKLPARET